MRLTRARPPTLPRPLPEAGRPSRHQAPRSRTDHRARSLFRVSDPFASRDREISAREILDAGAERIDKELANQPAIQMRLMRTIGAVYDRLELADKAKPLLKRSLELTESLYGPESLEAADSLDALGGISKGVEYHVHAHAIRSRLLKPDDPRMIRSLYLLGAAQVAANLPEAETSLSRALDWIERSTQPDEQLHLWILNDLAIVHGEQRHDYRAALALSRKALSIRERIYPEGHADRVMGMMNLADFLLESGEPQQARSYLEPALTSAEKALGPDHPLVANALVSLAKLERREGRSDRARPLMERALAIYEKQIARGGSIAEVKDPGNYVEALQSLGLVDEAQGRWEEALDHLGRARDLFLRGVGFKDASADYARVLRATGRIGEAGQVEASSKVDAKGTPTPDQATKR